MDAKQYEREFYSIFVNDEGEKCFKFWGFTYDTTEGERSWRSNEICWCEAPLADVLDQGVKSWIADEHPECKQYLADLTEPELANTCNTYFNGKPGVELSLDEVDADTRAGDYWCQLA